MRPNIMFRQTNITDRVNIPNFRAYGKNIYENCATLIKDFMCFIPKKM